MKKEVVKINIDLIFICVRHCMRVWKKSDALAPMRPMLNEEYYNNLIFFLRAYLGQVLI